MLDETRIAEGFWRAACGEIAWETAIDAIAAPLDCRSGQVVVIERKAVLVAAVLSRMTPADLRDIETHRVADPSINPRILGLLRTAPGKCIVDDDLLSPGERRTLPIYRDFFVPAGSDSAALIRSSNSDGEACIAFTLLGSEGCCTTTAPIHRLLERLLPAITDAARLAVRFGRMHANAMAVALDDHRRPCIALRRDMVPTAISHGAERVLSSGQYLGMRHGRLHATMRRNLIALPPTTVDRPTIVASLTPVPDGGLSETCALLTLPDQAAPDDVSQVLVDAYRLTRTEAIIAVAIAAGKGPSQIAAERNQSRGTVRAHLRSIMAKTDTHRQSEIAALIGRLSN